MPSVLGQRRGRRFCNYSTASKAVGSWTLKRAECLPAALAPIRTPIWWTADTEIKIRRWVQVQISTTSRHQASLTAKCHLRQSVNGTATTPSSAHPIYSQMAADGKKAQTPKSLRSIVASVTMAASGGWVLLGLQSTVTSVACIRANNMMLHNSLVSEIICL